MGRDEHWDEIALFDGFFLSTIVYLIAGRIGYILLHLDSVGTLYRSLAILAYPGINQIVGIVATLVFVMLFARAHNWDEWKTADAYVVSLAIVLALGGLGGLLNGSNPGLPVSWGLMYPGETVARIPVDLWIFLWALVTFAIVSRVRKNFRFYSWYKGESSVAQEGLAALVFIICAGVYYLVLGWISQSMGKVWVLPFEFIAGLGLIVAGLLLIRQRVGRRDDTVWGKLKGITSNIRYRLGKRSS